MIHSPRSMPTGNFDDSAQAITPPDAAKRSVRVPADYYAAPLSEVRPVFPKWVPYGCGSAAAVFIVLLFLGSLVLSGPRLGQFLDFVIGTSLGDVRPMIAADVPADQKQAFETEVKRMREGMRNGTVPVQNVQPFLKAMQTAIADKKVDRNELQSLTVAAREAASKKAPAAPARK